MAAQENLPLASEESFGPTNGSTAAWVGIGACVLIVGGVVVQDRSVEGLRTAVGAAAVAWVLYLFLLRPRVLLSKETLTLRGSVGDVSIPVRSVSAVRVGAYTRVWCGECKRFSTAAVGRGGRRARIALKPEVGPPSLGEGDVLQARVDLLLGARERAGLSAETDLLPRRTWAWRELGVLAGLVAVFGLTLLL